MPTFNDLSEEVVAMIVEELYTIHAESVATNALAAFAVMDDESNPYITLRHDEHEKDGEIQVMPDTDDFNGLVCKQAGDILVDLSIFQAMRVSRRLRETVLGVWGRHTGINTLQHIMLCEASLWKKCALTINYYFKEKVQELASQHLNPYSAKLLDQNSLGRVAEEIRTAKMPVSPDSPEWPNWPPQKFESEVSKWVDAMTCGREEQGWTLFDCDKCDVPVVLFEGGECPYHGAHARGTRIAEADCGDRRESGQQGALDWDEEGLLEIVGLETVNAEEIESVFFRGDPDTVIEGLFAEVEAN